MSHTPGPWRAEILDEGFSDWRLFMPNPQLPGGEECVMCNTTYYPWTPTNQDDWRLIAAAPELLAALNRVLHLYEDGSDTWPSIQLLIAKAEGKA